MICKNQNPTLPPVSRKYRERKVSILYVAEGIQHHTTFKAPINIKAAKHCSAIEQKAMGFPPKLCETEI